MGYTRLKKVPVQKNYAKFGLEEAALAFIREDCEGLRFDQEKDKMEYKIPYNMQRDTDRLCLENAIERFLKSGKKEDAFDVYFCYLEMFVGDYEKTRRMIELLSEFEANGSRLLMKHRDHYSHSAYVFVLGLAIYESNTVFREAYNTYYGLKDAHEAACHYLQYWGLTALFHDIGYPFELPFEQVASYFEVNGEKRDGKPYVAYHAMDSFVTIDEKSKKALSEIYTGLKFATTNELFAYVLAEKLGKTYSVTKEQMLTCLTEKPAKPDSFNYFMDHAYFSATVLFKKLFEELSCEIREENIDALTAILMHNSLYKFSIAKYKSDNNIPFAVQIHPLAYMLMLCDELQCWDRTAYGRNSKKELHPMGCTFDFSGNAIKATYLYDKKEIAKINRFKEDYQEWLSDKQGEQPKLKAYSGMYIKNSNGISGFQEDIERIVDLSVIKLNVQTDLGENIHGNNRSYLSDSNFINLYNFATVLNGRWEKAEEWRKAKEVGQEESFLNDKNLIKAFEDSFKGLSLEYKLSNINQAKRFAYYMNVIGCFYTDKETDFEVMEEFTAEEMAKIGPLEHKRWLQEHYDMGWEYGEPTREERDLLRQHKDMIPGFDPCHPVSDEEAEANYERLDMAEQNKDVEPMNCMLSMLRLYDGLRIYRLK